MTALALDPETRSDWMHALPQRVKRKPLRELLLPGTHDSAAYALANAHLATSRKRWEYWVERFSRLSAVSRFMHSWTLTQELSILEQLELGVRALDLRLAFSEHTQQFYFAHRFACAPALHCIWQVRRFLEQHPGEVVMLFIRRDHVNRERVTAERATEFLALATQILGEHMLPPTTSRRLPDTYTLERLVQIGKRCVVWFEGEGSGTFVWPRAFRRGSGMTTELAQKEENLQQYLARLARADPRDVHTLPLTLTPDNELIVGALKRKLICRSASINSIAELNQSLAARLLPLLQDYAEANQLRRVSVISIDFVQADFIDWIIAYNLEHL